MDAGGSAVRTFQYRPLGFSLGLGLGAAAAGAQPAAPSTAAARGVGATPEATSASSVLQLLASTPLGKSLLPAILPASSRSAGVAQVRVDVI